MTRHPLALATLALAAGLSSAAIAPSAATNAPAGSVDALAGAAGTTPVVNAASLLGPATASATFPGRNGRITYMQADANGVWQVWVARADLTARKRITHSSAYSGWPVWNPRRNLIAFESDRSDHDPTDDAAVIDIFVKRATGTGLRKVTDSVGVSSDAAWSPNGRRIVFSADRGRYPTRQGIYVMRVDGTNMRRITSFPGDAGVDTAPRFSPNGRRIVFTRYLDEGAGERGSLFTIRSDGSHERRVTPETVSAGDADWSPNGRWLVFEADSDVSYRGGIFKIRPDGSRLRDLTRNDGALAGSADPVWSPDGRKILFLSARRKSETEDFTLGLTTMWPDGSHRRFVSANPVEQHQPDWQSIG